MLAVFYGLVREVIRGEGLCIAIVLLLLTVYAVSAGIKFFDVRKLMYCLLKKFCSEGCRSPGLVGVESGLGALPGLTCPLDLVILAIVVAISCRAVPRCILVVRGLVTYFLF